MSTDRPSLTNYEVWLLFWKGERHMEVLLTNNRYCSPLLDYINSLNEEELVRLKIGFDPSQPYQLWLVDKAAKRRDAKSWKGFLVASRDCLMVDMDIPFGEGEPNPERLTETVQIEQLETLEVDLWDRLQQNPATKMSKAEIKALQPYLVGVQPYRDTNPRAWATFHAMEKLLLLMGEEETDGESEAEVHTEDAEVAGGT